MSKPNQILVLLLTTILSGCMNKATATFDPGRDIVSSNTFFVEKFPPDKHALNHLIVDALVERGYTASTGEDGQEPLEGTDILVTYRDKWQWDMSMYMLELSIQFRDPESRAAFASGMSYHTSMTRMSPEAMTNEILTNIFEEDQAGQVVGSD